MKRHIRNPGIALVLAAEFILAPLAVWAQRPSLGGLQLTQVERTRLQIRFNRAGSGYENSELICSTNLNDWVPLADGPTVDGDDYVVSHNVGEQEFFRVVPRAAYQFNPAPNPGAGEFMLQGEDGKMRRVLIYIPDGYPNNPPAPPAETGPVLCPPAWPLAIIGHGNGQTAASFEQLHPALIAKCNAEGVILVLPQATRNPLSPSNNHSWNSAETLGRRDDVLFLIRLVERLQGQLGIDDSRIYIGGYSGGGEISQLASVRTPRLFAACASVATSVPNTDRLDPTTVPVCPAPGLPILLVNGKIDFSRPYYGGPSSLPAPDAAAWWLETNGCADLPALTLLGDFDPSHAFLSWPGLSSPNVAQEIRDDLNATLPSIGTIESWCPQQYPCPSQHAVNLVSLSAMDHIWPDVADDVGYDANEEVIDFFLSHRKVPMKDAGPFLAVPRTAGGTRGPFQDIGQNPPNVIHRIPPNPKAVVFVSHGANQDATFVDCLEVTATLEELGSQGIGWVAWDSSVPGNWDLANGLATGNADIQFAMAIRNTLMSAGQFNPSVPIYTMGYDQGAMFALLLGYTFEQLGDPIKGIAQLSPNYGNPLPAATDNAAKNTQLPHYLYVTECDPYANKLASVKYLEQIRYRSQGQMDHSRLCVSVEKCPEPSRFNRIVPAVNSAGIMTALEAQSIIALDGGLWRRNFCKLQLATVLQSISFPAGLNLTLEQEKEVRGQIRVIFAAHEPDAGCASKLAEFFCGALVWIPGGDDLPDPQAP